MSVNEDYVLNLKVQFGDAKTIDDLHKALEAVAAAIDEVNEAGGDTSGLRKLETEFANLYSIVQSSDRATKAMGEQLRTLGTDASHAATELKKAQDALGLANQAKFAGMDSAGQAKQFSKDWDAALKENVARTKASSAQRVREEAQAEKQIEANARASGNRLGQFYQGQTKARVQLAKQEARDVIAEQKRIEKERLNAPAKQKAADDAYYGNLARVSYALNDVSRQWRNVALATGAAGAGIVAISAQYEQLFKSVERVTAGQGANMDKLKNDLVGITTEMNQSFRDIAEIATLAGQLDVPANAIANFTEVVAMFAATTDVSVDRAATAIGRTAQLTSTAANEYENLASAIYATGVTSVATEGEILAITEQIATAGDLAGFANHEIVALASALASLGIRPEAARGSMMRIFNTIDKAAMESGEKLNSLARVAGVSANEFAEAWERDPQEAFSAFIRGMGYMQEAGKNTYGILKDLGIGAVRDQRAIQVLANNYEVYAQALGVTAQAYAEGTALSEGFGIQQDNLIDKFGKLMNTLQGIASNSAEFNAVLKPLIDGLTELAKQLLAFSQSPVGKVVNTFSTGLLLLVAAAAAGNAAITGLNSVWGRFVTIGYEGDIVLNKNARSWGLFRKGVMSSIPWVKQSTAAVQENTVALGQQDAQLTRTKAGAVGAGKSFAGLLKTGGVMIGVTAALWGIGQAIEYIGEQSKSAHDKSSEFFDGFAGLSDAIAADTKAVADGTEVSFRSLQVQVADSTDSQKPWQEALRRSAGLQDDLAKSAQQAGDVVAQQTIEIAGNTRAWLAKELAANEDIRDLWENHSELLQTAGMSLGDITEEFLQTGSAEKSIESLTAKLQELMQAELEASAARHSGDPSFTEVAGAEARLITQKYNDIAGVARNVGVALDGLNTEIEENQTQFEILSAIVGDDMARKLSGMADEVGGAEDAVGSLSDALKELTSVAGNLVGVENAFAGLEKTLGENGLAINSFTEEGRKNFAAFETLFNSVVSNAGDDSAKLLNDLWAMSNGISEAGVSVEGDLNIVNEAIAALFNEKYGLDIDTSYARESLDYFIVKAIEAQRVILQIARKDLGQAFATSLGAQNPAEFQRMSQARADAAARVAQAEGDLAALEQERVRGLEQTRKIIPKVTDETDKNTRANRNNAKSVKEQVTTLSDYVSDLEKVLADTANFRFGVDNAFDDIQNKWEALSESVQDGLLDIEGALERAFGVSDAQDGVTSTFYDMQDAAEDAARRIRDSIAEINALLSDLQTLGADRTTLQYQLEIAEKYGNTLNAERIRAKLAENAVKQEEKRNDLLDARASKLQAEQDASTQLAGNTRAAIANRKALRDLIKQHADYLRALEKSGKSEEQLQKETVKARKTFEQQAAQLGFNSDQVGVLGGVFGDFLRAETLTSQALTGNTKDARDNRRAIQDVAGAYQQYIMRLIESGASQKTVNAAIQKSEKDFIAQGKALGFSEAELKKYAATFTDLSTVIAGMPKNVTIAFDANTDPATRAINEWRAKNTGGKGLSAPITTNHTVNASVSGMDYAAEKMRRFTEYLKAARLYQDALNPYNPALANTRWTAMDTASKNYKNYYDGGYTGRGGKYEAAGTVHAGEYVNPARDVNQSTGRPYLAAAVRSATGHDMIVVELSPTDRSLLAAAGNVTVTMDGRVVARATNRGNQNSNVRGGA